MQMCNTPLWIIITHNYLYIYVNEALPYDHALFELTFA